MTHSSLQTSTYLILAALADQPRHGYAIMRDATELSGGAVKIRAGTLYAALDRLTNEGLVVVDHEEVIESRLRRYYRLTATGVAVLTEETAARAAMARATGRRLRGLNAHGAQAR
ncbi:PadR family transcriptional regulator [Antricoccus suffuscus]|uniref:PadR family transcriptional regulator n=1 Tax=Antricoccus suffuscus TaxID=1629062 RepID=A0A2T1A4L2_9ACTN|nr:PadR family transcriptional regulator [Antricoccus suffuscus]PRZ43535.1 PadR family transcriptional regulator [Antricoccus suffuscus]